MTLLESRQSKDVFGEHSDEDFSMTVFNLFVDDVVDPGIIFLKNKRDSVDIEK